ncbi:MAG: sigma-70 family RNA polymerase sigma factor [Caldilineaceae bacterium]
MTDEGVLIRRAQQGDVAAFEALINLHAQPVYNLALRVLRQPEEAEDLAQETFLRAWRGLVRFRGEARFSTWLYRIALNLCYNHLPRLQQELATLTSDEAALDLPDQRAEVSTHLLSTELAAFLHHAIDELPESYRLLITLRHLHEMSYNDIADLTGLPLGTVKTGIYRARLLLKEQLMHYQGDV